MKKMTPYITEEHIVAHLDGELEAGSEFNESVASSSELRSAMNEYAALDRAFALSRTDRRFSLGPKADARVRAALEQEIARTRKTVRMPERAPIAEPVKGSPAIERSKKIWVRRSSYALALLLLGCFVWFGTHTGSPEQPRTATLEPHSAAAPAAVETPTVPATTNSVAASPATDHVSSPAPSATHRSAPASIASETKNDLANNTESSVTNVSDARHSTETDDASVTVDHDPAAIMASHRFAKLIKATPPVVITQQDKM